MTDYWLDDKVSLLAEGGYFSFCNHDEASSEAHKVSYLMSTKASSAKKKSTHL
jgi:hypothetical protein